jgi:hypothetical protein
MTQTNRCHLWNPALNQNGEYEYPEGQKLWMMSLSLNVQSELATYAWAPAEAQCTLHTTESSIAKGEEDMKKKRLEKLMLNRETLRELSFEEAREVVGGSDGNFSLVQGSCNPCDPARGHIPIG